MDIRSSMEGLRSLLGVNPAATADCFRKVRAAQAPLQPEVRSTVTGRRSAARPAKCRRQFREKARERIRWQPSRTRLLPETTTCRRRR